MPSILVPKITSAFRPASWTSTPSTAGKTLGSVPSILTVIGCLLLLIDQGGGKRGRIMLASAAGFGLVVDLRPASRSWLYGRQGQGAMQQTWRPTGKRRVGI